MCHWVFVGPDTVLKVVVVVKMTEPRCHAHYDAADLAPGDHLTLQVLQQRAHGIELGNQVELRRGRASSRHGFLGNVCEVFDDVVVRGGV